MLMQFFLFGMGTTLEVKACVLLMCVGVGLATVSELSITVVGFVVGMAAVIGAAQQQVSDRAETFAWRQVLILCVRCCI